jgi:hypothetical protein
LLAALQSVASSSEPDSDSDLDPNDDPDNSDFDPNDNPDDVDDPDEVDDDPRSYVWGAERLAPDSSCARQIRQGWETECSQRSASRPGGEVNPRHTVTHPRLSPGLVFRVLWLSSHRCRPNRPSSLDPKSPTCCVPLPRHPTRTMLW